MQEGYAAYRRVGLETSSGPQLLLALYDGAIRFLGLAAQGLQDQNHEQAHANLVRTQNILMELTNDLDLTYGEIPERLEQLYIYLHRRLVEANVEKDLEAVREVDRHLQRLRTTWRSAILQASAEPSPSGGADPATDIQPSAA